MNIEKALLCAGAVLAVLALAAPTAAMAEDYVVYDAAMNETITEEVQVPLTGKFGVFTPLGSFACNEDLTLTTEDGSSATTNADFTFTTSTCEGTGALEGCELIESELEESWETEITSQDFIIRNGNLLIEMTGEECPIEEVESHFPEITASVDNPNGITEGELSGEGISTVFGLELEVEAFGTYEVLGEDAGTYGIEPK